MQAIPSHRSRLQKVVMGSAGKALNARVPAAFPASLARKYSAGSSARRSPRLAADASQLNAADSSFDIPLPSSARMPI